MRVRYCLTNDMCHAPFMRYKKYLGFSLFEILVVIVILMVLLGVVWPSYRKLLMGAYHYNVQIQLIALALKLQRYYDQHGSYLGAVIPAQQAHYHFHFRSLHSDYFFLEAVFDERADCQRLSIDALGVRRASRRGCWEID